MLVLVAGRRDEPRGGRATVHLAANRRQARRAVVAEDRCQPARAGRRSAATPGSWVRSPGRTDYVRGCRCHRRRRSVDDASCSPRHTRRRHVRRHRHREPLRRRPHRHAAGPPGPPRPGRRSGLVPERRPVRPHHPAGRDGPPGPLGPARAGPCHGRPHACRTSASTSATSSSRAHRCPSTGSTPPCASAARSSIRCSPTPPPKPAPRSATASRSPSCVRDGDRVVGIRGHDGAGRPVEERASIVVGADGVNSIVARSVAAPRLPRAPGHAPSPSTPTGGVSNLDRIELYARPGRFFIATPTNDGAHARGRSRSPSPTPPATGAGPPAPSPRRWPRSPGSPPVSRRRSGSSASAAPTSTTASSGSRPGRVGPSSAMRATTRTRSPLRGCSTPSATPSCSPGPIDDGLDGDLAAAMRRLPAGARHRGPARCTS